MAKSVAKTYGQALFDLGIEDGSIESYAQQAQTICSLFKENPELLKFLTHPEIAKEEKIATIEKCFKGRVDDALTGFMVVVIKAGRQAVIEGIFAYFLDTVKS